MLVDSINQQIGEKVSKLIEDEEQFYLQAERDVLKTPPYVYVKRIDRPWLSHLKVNTLTPAKKEAGYLGMTGSKAKGQSRSRSKGKRVEYTGEKEKTTLRDAVKSGLGEV